jgi:hypothetical protein
MDAQRREQFWQLLDRAAGERFEYGRFDCVILAARVYELVTGRKAPMRAQGWRWSSEEEQRALLSRLGGLEQALHVGLGPSVPAGQCRMGDLVLVRVLGHSILCVHDGGKLVAPADDCGLRRLPRSLAVCGWRLSDA